MGKSNYADKRDANEKEIIDWLRERGCRVIQMPRGAGYDLQVFAPGGAILPPVEVKNPRYNWNYETAEAELMVWCHDNNVPYETITSVDEMASALLAYTRMVATA
jgi:hypothetical protein